MVFRAGTGFVAVTDLPVSDDEEEEEEETQAWSALAGLNQAVLSR